MRTNQTSQSMRRRLPHHKHRPRVVGRQVSRVRTKYVLCDTRHVRSHQNQIGIEFVGCLPQRCLHLYGRIVTDHLFGVNFGPVSLCSGGGEIFQIVFLVGLFALFYFNAIRPPRKRQKEHAQMVAALGKGDEVVTSSGILGRITGLDDNYVVLNVANNVDMKFQRIHIHAVLPKGTLKSIG